MINSFTRRSWPGKERRCIEVKGPARTDEIEVTDNEWARACNLRADYWLYAVYHCATPTPQMVRVQDPFRSLLAKAKGSILISHSTMAQVAER